LEDIIEQLLENKYTFTLGQLFRIILNFKQYVAAKCTPRRGSVIAPRSNLVITSMVIDPHMVVIQVQVSKIMVEDVLLDGRLDVNIMIEELQKWLGLPSPKLTPYILWMVDQTITKPIVLIKDLKIHIHGISYIAMFTVMKNNVLDSTYFMLLSQPWLSNAFVTHD
jgi:hypothetical protein